MKSHPKWKDQALAAEIVARLAEMGLTAVARDCERPSQFNVLLLNAAAVTATADLVAAYVANCEAFAQASMDASG